MSRSSASWSDDTGVEAAETSYEVEGWTPERRDAAGEVPPAVAEEGVMEMEGRSEVTLYFEETAFPVQCQQL